MSELRSPLDLPGIDSVEDLDGDVDGFDVHLDDLSLGDVVTMNADTPEWAAKYVVTGRTDALDKSADDTDIIELDALDPSTSIVSCPASVASLHHRAARGEIEVETGWRGLATWLLGRGRFHWRVLWKYRIKGHDDLDDSAEESDE